MNRILLASTLSAFLFTMPSCSDAAAASPAGDYECVIEPTVKAMLANEKMAALPDEMKSKMKESFSKDLAKTVFTMKDDNTFSGSMELTIPGIGAQKQTFKGTWKLEGEKITFNQTHQDGKEHKATQTGTYKDGALEVSFGDEGKKMPMHLKKKVAEKK